MATFYSSLCLAAVGCAVVGCSFKHYVRGVVHTVADPCAAPGDGAPKEVPVDGAMVSLKCPNSPGSSDGQQEAFRLITDQTGSVVKVMEQPVPARCTLHVEKKGFVPWSAAIEDICGDEPLIEDSPYLCHDFSVTARLVRSISAAVPAVPPPAPTDQPTSAPPTDEPAPTQSSATPEPS